MESLYQKALNAMPGAVFLVDDDYRVKYCNSVFSELFDTVVEGQLLGDAVHCGDNCGSVCGKGKNCALCGLRHAAAEAKRSPFGTYQGAVSKTVLSGEGKVAVTFDVRITDLGGYFLGIIDNMHAGLEEDIERAARMQRGFLPDKNVDVGANFDYLYLPVKRVGGDLLDVYNGGGKPSAFVADVSGKGVTAAMLTSFVKATYRRDLPFSKNFREMQRGFLRLGADDRSYVTVLALSLSADGKKATYCSAGHSLPLLQKTGGKVVKRYAPAPPVSGWFNDVKYRSHTAKAKKGDLFVLATDGVTDLVGKSGETFGLKRLCAVLEKSNGAKEFLQTLKEEIRSFCDKQTDDLTVLCIEV